MLINICSPRTFYRWQEIHSITSHQLPLDPCCPLMQGSKVLERLLVFFSIFPERVGIRKCNITPMCTVRPPWVGSLKLIFTMLINLMSLEQSHHKHWDLLWWSFKMHFHGSMMELLQWQDWLWAWWKLISLTPQSWSALGRGQFHVSACHSHGTLWYNACHTQ